MDEAKNLTPESIHCYFDLRRLVACSRDRAMELKREPQIDAVLANPDQFKPSGKVFSGRVGVCFDPKSGLLPERINDWAERRQITIKYNADISLQDGQLTAAGSVLSEDYDASIVAMPLSAICDIESDRLDVRQLSIYYLQLNESIANDCPAYYILNHDESFHISRLVNYDAYSASNQKNGRGVIAAEVLHRVAEAPSLEDIELEVRKIFPMSDVHQSFEVRHKLSILSPSIRNKGHLDQLQQRIESNYRGKPVFFTGMRTDAGIFFSHQTIGAAYQAALDCKKRLSRNQ